MLKLDQNFNFKENHKNFKFSNLAPQAFGNESCISSIIVKKVSSTLIIFCYQLSEKGEVFCFVEKDKDLELYSQMNSFSTTKARLAHHLQTVDQYGLYTRMVQ